MYKYNNHFMWSNEIINSEDTKSRDSVRINFENCEKIKTHYQKEKSLLDEEELNFLAQLELMAVFKTIEYHHQDSLNSMLQNKLEEQGMNLREAMVEARKQVPLVNWMTKLSKEDSEMLERISKKMPQKYKNWLIGVTEMRKESLLELVMLIRDKTKRKILFEAI